MRQLVIEIAGLQPGNRILAPSGRTSPQDSVDTTTVTGGQITAAALEADLDLTAVWIEASGDTLTISHAISQVKWAQGYPEAAFLPHVTPYTIAADNLVQVSRAIVAKAGEGRAGIEALVAEAEARFTYGKPDVRFNDCTDKVPNLSCGTTPGSCVDIKTYLMANLRAAGYQAGYVHGYFFPKEKVGVTNDMRCWVVTRHAGEVLEWDIAHHMKSGLGLMNRASIHVPAGAWRADIPWGTAIA